MDDINRLRELFDAAREWASELQRQQFLDNACGDDQPLRRRVDALLAADRDAGSFLQADDQAEVTVQSTATANGIGTHIGPYTIRERLAEGGMGIVYVADQTEPVRRRVALKIIKPGMASNNVISRFEVERQALAMMDHPNIARIFDGGATESGQPFFAMELVQGLPITQYCDEHKLSTNERLKLFSQVCRAVQHAHQKGIIHRDIKPSNVLVATIDGTPVPKVIDFGVAKTLNQKLSHETVYTQFAQMVGTPLYMSPEQVDLGTLDIDTRSDVYSLGVLLYELLTGNTPFDRETLQHSGFDEFRRILREEEPRRPSQAISTLKADALSTVCERRASDPRKLTHSLRGELDWIVMKTLEKDRSRRYESPNTLAADLDRYLRNEPVTAKPPSIAYRVRKFAQRNRRSLVAALLTVMVVLGGLSWVVGTKIQQDRQRRQLMQDGRQTLAGARALIDHGDLSTAQRRIAELHGRLSNVDFRVPKLHAMIRRLSDEIEQRKKAQDRFQQFDTLAQDAMNDLPHGEDDEGTLWGLQALAIYKVLEDEQWLEQLDGNFLNRQQKDKLCQTAYELLLVLADAKIRYNDSRTEQTAQKCLRYLDIAATFHKPTRALYWVRSECYRYLKNDVRAEEAREQFEKATANTAFDYFLPGHTASWRGDLEEAIQSYKAALRIQPDHFNSLFFLADRLSKLGKRAEAAEVYRACLALRPRDTGTLRNRGFLLSQLGEHEEAIALLNQAIEAEPKKSVNWMSRAIVQTEMGDFDLAAVDFHKSLELAPDSANAHSNFGNFLLKRGNLDAALVEFDRALEIDPNHAMALLGRANVLQKRGDRDTAVASLTKAIQNCPQDSRLFSGRGVVLRTMGRYDESLADFDRAIELDRHSALAYFHRSGTYFARGEHDAALADLNRAIELEPNAEYFAYRGVVQQQLEHYEQALADCRQAIDLDSNCAIAYNQIAWLKTNCPNSAFRDISEATKLAARAVELSPRDPAIRNTLGVAQYRAGKYTAAVENLTKSLELGDIANACDGIFLAMAHWQLGDEQQAHKWYRKSMKWMNEGNSTDQDLIRFCREAQELLGIDRETEKFEEPEARIGPKSETADKGPTGHPGD